MRAFILRRVGLIQEGSAGSVLVGRPGAPDLVRLQGFLAGNGYPYTVLDASADEEGRAVVERFGVQPEELPLMVCPNGTVLKRPTEAEAAVCLGITPDLDPQSGWLRVEEFVDEGTLVVRAELPDIDPDKDVELSVANGVLHIRAQREEKTEKKDKDVYRSEFRYGSFVRNVPLPEGVKEDDITASYKDGILEIRAPIAAEEEKPPVTKVPISRE